MRHRFNPRKRVNDYQRYSMLGAQVYVLYPRQFIFGLSCKRRSFLQVLQSIRRIFWKNFLCFWWWTNVYGENMVLKQKIIKKIRIWLRQWSITYVRKRQLSEGRIFPKTEFVKKFTEWARSVDWIHDMIIVKWREVTAIFNFSENRICPNIYRMFRSVDWTHDMTIVKWHLFHLTRAQILTLWPSRSDKCATGSIHANGSMDYQRYSMARRSGLCLVPSAIHLRSEAASDDHFCRYYNP